MTSKRYRWPCVEPVEVLAETILTKAKAAFGAEPDDAKSGYFLHRSSSETIVRDIALRVVPRRDPFTDMEVGRALTALHLELLRPDGPRQWDSAILGAAGDALIDRAQGTAATTVEDVNDKLQVILDDLETFMACDQLVEGRLRMIAADVRAMSAGKLPRRGRIASHAGRSRSSARDTAPQVAA